ncbi:type II toxin-antitoxin system Phd/YefM family antitoxin [Thermoanaerobacterium thermosaccharolyticum]|jgi:prevent-host-death family protein|uniref:type II toxin-antitoxin system Phd/YefM family antitoxin n=1 Tax=Thermoanaerobacterium thermosaccharolyticum TaxID=1517 RepID=UPI0017806F27|nr:type II toxin-antitoxin system prevent-host-death family antitoxin [Thermoanaerobacterium thermosaccharolyticum]MBE0069247.1 type II toxin-antitoxin system prevent-host-death family antitoxin [Thermoanaerobacterium thermosaccharolyticum]MBE0229033.1 type II toxin-antitoxin system prevent-host-death family antitoxin [Thermoanaerobacterium thermosaccharolyticum]
MQITATEFKNNIGKYLAIASKEDIYITKNGKAIAKLTNTKQDKVEMAKSLFGILPADASLEQAREKRLSRHERIN